MEIETPPSHIFLVIWIKSRIFVETKYMDDTHDFMTEDTTVAISGGTWNVRVTRPKSDTTPRSAIIFMVGAGEVGAGNFAGLAQNGPHYWLSHGWDGSVVLPAGTKYPIIISIGPHFAWPSTRATGDLLIYLLSKYPIKPGGVHLTGLSMGGMTFGRVMTAEKSVGDNTYQKLVKTFTPLQGDGAAPGSPDYMLAGDIPIGQGWEGITNWTKKYDGRVFVLSGTNDFSGPGGFHTAYAANDGSAGSAYFRYETIGGGSHCCWNNMYDPSVKNWLTAPYLTDTAFDGVHKLDGTYKEPNSIFQWMLSQESTVVTPPPVDPPPVDPPAGTAVRIQAEAWTSKSGSQYAAPSSDADGGLYVAGLTQNSSLIYAARVPAAGTYTLSVRVATTQNNSQLKVGNTIYNIPNTGDWTKWKTVALGVVTMTSGTNTIQITLSSKETLNFDWFELAPVTIVDELPAANAGADSVYTIPASILNGTSTGIGVTQAWKLISIVPAADLSSSAYTYRLTATDSKGRTATDDVVVTVKF